MQFNSCSIIYVCVCGLTCCIHLGISPEKPCKWNWSVNSRQKKNWRLNQSFVYTKAPDFYILLAYKHVNKYALRHACLVVTAVRLSLRATKKTSLKEPGQGSNWSNIKAEKRVESDMGVELGGARRMRFEIQSNIEIWELTFLRMNSSKTKRPFPKHE